MSQRDPDKTDNLEFININMINEGSSLLSNKEKETEIDLSKAIEKDKYNKKHSEKFNEISISNDIYDINKIFDEAGYNILTIKNIFFCTLSFFIGGYYYHFLGYIYTPFQKYHQLSDNTLNFISILLYIGLVIGYITIELFLKIVNRRNGSLISLIVLLISTLITFLIDNIIIFSIFRLLSSIFLAYYLVFIYAITVEYLPVKFRSFILTLFNYFFELGAIYFLLFCKIYCPKLKYDPKDKNTPQDLNSAIFCIFYIEIFTLIVCYFFLKDSPRNLFLHNSLEEAGEILDYYVGRKLTNDEIKKIQFNFLNTGENSRGKKYSGIRIFFSQRFLKLTILTMLNSFIFFLLTYGIDIAIPVMLHEQKEDLLSTNVIDDLILYNLILFPLIPALLSEFKTLGKKYIIIILNFLAVLLAFIPFIVKDHSKIFIFSSVAALNYALMINLTWKTEFIPTKMRDAGYGLFLGTGKVGSIISPFLFIFLAKSGVYPTLIVYNVCLFFVIISVFFLPKNEILELDSEMELDESSDEENDNEDKQKR
jgi:AAHS family benzoate transporter-like MFS transporter